MLGNPELFSTKALGNRKRAEGFDPLGLDQYVARAWVPSSTTELRDLKRQLATYQKRFEQIYRPIRDAIFAHRLMSNDEAASALFTATSRGEVGIMLDFLHDFIDAIMGLYENGDEPVLGRRSYDQYNQRIRDGVQSVLRTLTTRERWSAGARQARQG
jgi:AbiU2